MKRRLGHIPEPVFHRFMRFAADHPEIARPEHVLQKLTIFNFAAPLIERYAPESMLEIGCGLGFHSALLSNHGRVSATELQVPGSFVADDDAVSEHRATVFQELAQSEVDFRFNDGRTLPFADASFDLIFHNSVIEHVPDAVAFNRETNRTLKPGGVVMCITGTPALCQFRWLRDHLLALPKTLAAALIKEAGVTGHRNIADRLAALIPDGASPASDAPAVKDWYARLAHYVHSPAYNVLVLEELAQSAGIDAGAALLAAQEHFAASALNRLRFYLTPRTHGQHYRDVRHEMSEWQLDRWRSTFSAAGFDVLDVIPYRFHHLLEATWSNKLNAAMYHRAAPLIERLQNVIPPGLASEFILVARQS